MLTPCLKVKISLLPLTLTKYFVAYSQIMLKINESSPA